MGVNRWRGLLGPPSLLVTTALLAAAVVPAALAAGPLGPPPAVEPCPPQALSADALAAARAASSNARVIPQVVLGARGEETGRQLLIQLGSGTSTVIGLPPESFVSGPFGQLLLYGSHAPAAGSYVRVLDLASGCDTLLAQPAGIVRGAVLDPAGGAIYVHSVTEPERRDAGVARHDVIAGSSAQVLEPLPDSQRYGPTFATSLVWSVDGRELAVQSCGFSACRTRALETSSGVVQSLDETPHGALLGFDHARLFVRDACHWEPCAVLEIERRTGAATVVAEEAYGATLSAVPEEGVLLIIETPAGRLEVVR